MFDKKDLAQGIGNFFGVYFEENGQFCIDNEELVFRYDTLDELLKDWVDTIVENHHDMHHFDETGREFDSWEEEIIFIYKDVIGKLPTGVRCVEGKSGAKWASSIDVSVPGETSPHGKNLHLGTYSSIVDAIFARKDFLEFYRSQETVTVDELAAYAANMRKAAKDLRTPKQDNDVVKQLIGAMFAYAEEFSWNDSDAIDALIDLGVTHADFQKAGFGDFVREYFKEEAGKEASLIDKIQEAEQRADSPAIAKETADPVR